MLNPQFPQGLIHKPRCLDAWTEDVLAFGALLTASKRSWQTALQILGFMQSPEPWKSPWFVVVMVIPGW